MASPRGRATNDVSRDQSDSGNDSDNGGSIWNPCATAGGIAPSCGGRATDDVGREESGGGGGGNDGCIGPPRDGAVMGSSSGRATNDVVRKRSGGVGDGEGIKIPARRRCDGLSLRGGGTDDVGREEHGGEGGSIGIPVCRRGDSSSLLEKMMQSA